MAVIGQTTDGKRKWVRAARVKGRFQRVHRWSGWLLMAFLLGVPWLNFHGVPVFRMDLPGRRLFALGAAFTPHDAIFIVLSLLFLAFGLFFFTSLYGRVWCGYACPQTVFLEELIRPVERLILGDRSKRLLLDKHRASPEWWLRHLVAWTVYLVLAGALSLALMGFFEDPRLLWTGHGSAGAYGVTAFFGAVLFADFAWFREQFCNYLCPYARFQGALTDDHSIQVMYKVGISEPRGNVRARREEPEQAFGKCIDCDKCVTVCPTGIDIRNGYQLECIGCARCIDACDGVMEKLGEGPGLIQYSSVAKEQGRKTGLLRPRTLVYAGLLSTLAVAFTILLGNRHELDVTLNRMPGTLYTMDADGWVRNTYFLQITNNHLDPVGREEDIEERGSHGAEHEDEDENHPGHRFELALSGLAEGEIIAPEVMVHSEEMVTVPVVIRVPVAGLHQRTLPFQLELTTDFDRVVVGSTFKSGAKEVD